MQGPRSVVFMVPGRLGTLTGGYGYDRRMVAGLRRLGWAVRVEELDPSFPRPTPSALADAAGRLSMIPLATPVIVDGLAMGAMPDLIDAESSRLAFIALVHHPLAAETGIDSATATLMKASERRALAAARLVVVTSRATARALGAYGVHEERIRVVEPGTDPSPPAHGSAGQRLQLLCVGTFIPRKGHRILFEALAGIAEQRWALTCVGSLDRDEGTVRELRATLARLGLEKRVELQDEVSEELLAGYYDGADVFVLPTLYEGYGMVVAEALARGLPVVSTTTGAIAELVGNEAGVLVTPGDLPALRSALTAVIESTQLRARLAEGARRVRDRLSSWEDASARLAESVERVAGN
ncbi:MAG: glycosyl transferase group 1 [Acidobacteria bacterium]|nr:MAG: glycosyl transferase group 1 [Acidobacteriota bacterium]